MNKNKLAWIVAGLLTVVILVGGVWYYKKKTASAAPSNYLTGEVKRGSISKTINATGTIQYPSQYNLSFTGKGKITKVNVAVGDTVKAGQVLAEIDSTTANQQVLQAKASLTQAQIKLDQLKAGATQADLLASQSSVAQQEANLYNAQVSLDSVKNNPLSTPTDIQKAQNSYNSAKASYDLAKAQFEAKKAGASSSDIQLAQLQVDQAKSSLASAQAAVTDTTLVAPVDGLITTVNGKLGEMPSGTGAFMVLMGASDSMQITVPVDEADLGSVKVEQAVALTLSAYPDKKFSGKVTQVAPTGKTQNNVTMFDVTVVAPNTDNLMKPGMSANVSIIVAQKNNVLTVPSEAVKGSGEQRSVQLAPESPTAQPQSKRVQIGLDDGTNAEVLQGLQEGDQVVTGTKTQKTTTNTQSGGGNRGGVGGMFGR